MEHLGTRMSRWTDVVCFSHLRWDFVFQRPNHLMSRCAREARVFFFEEPIYTEGQEDAIGLDVLRIEGRLWRATPRLPRAMDPTRRNRALARLLDDLIEDREIREPVFWYYTPMALDMSRHLDPILAIYDCMDELSNFAGAPPELKKLEKELFARADLVFTGGYSLYEAKRAQHPNVHPFPSSVDTAHFKKARTELDEPRDQAALPHPRLGFYGVIDERMDLALLDAVASARPEWQLVLIGPVVKIDEGSLPRRPNIHHLGKKDYAELPAYLRGWEVAMMPFALNDATRFISPTKTLEYLAAGRPVVSTAIQDVVRPYEGLGLVRIGRDPQGFVHAVDAALAEPRGVRLKEVDRFLADISWDRTWCRMEALMRSALSEKSPEDAIVAAGAPMSGEDRLEAGGVGAAAPWVEAE
jgi:glycosyltransferase involved in cell wall biosynthesis